MPQHSFPNTFSPHAPTRRGFFRDLALGAAGLTLGGGMLPGSALAAPEGPDESRVSFVTGNDRRDMVFQALKPFEREIREGIRGKQVVIKTNFVWHGTPLCATHPDAVRGLLDFLKPLYDKPILLGESSASPEGILSLFDGYGYSPLKNEYSIKFVELNEQPTEDFFILGKNLAPRKIQLITTLFDPGNFVFSITRPKAHNVVVATLGLKNMVMGSPLKLYKGVSHKAMMHGPVEAVSPWYLNYNMFLVARKVRPGFTVIDGLEGMQGNGPIEGTPVRHGFALAGPDVLAVDRIGMDLMGVDIADVGYLNFCADAGLGRIDREKIKIIGTENPARHVIKYKLNDNIEYQLKWKKDMEMKG